jgi:hypothetical protein
MSLTRVDEVFVSIGELIAAGVIAGTAAASTLVDGEGDVEDVSTAATGATSVPESGPTSDMKLISALMISFEVTAQGSTMTISPSTLVTLTLTLLVPKPLLFSKKL